MIFDAHTHIHFPAYDKDREEVIGRAKKAGVKMITVGTNYQTSKEAVELSEKYPDDIWATVGFHPAHTYSQYHDKKELRKPGREEFDLGKFKDLAKSKKVVAIGECGLDYYRIDGNKSEIIEKQKKVFIEQIKLAEEVQKPLMIHCRPSKGTDDAYEDLIQQFQISNFQSPKIIHFFVGSMAITKKLLDMGCYFTFGGAVTFSRPARNASASVAGGDYDAVIKYIPLDKIMLETDAPYVSPEPYRGQRNEPAYVIEVAKKIANVREVSYEEVVRQATENVIKVFGII